MYCDFILNGEGLGPVGNMLGQMRWDPGMLRPFYAQDGQRMVTVNTGRFKYDPKSGLPKPVYANVPIGNLMQQGIFSPVFNSTSLRKEEWIQLDNIILKAARFRLRAWSDLAAAASFSGFDGMGKMMLEHETMSDPGEAMVDMDAITEGRGDAPKFQLEGIPLPITHSDFWFSKRRLMISRNSGTPLNTVMGECAGRRIGELIEQTLIGNVTGITYGGGSNSPGYGRTPTVYGYTNFPNRITKTNMTIPTGSNPEATVGDILTILDLLAASKFYGPFMVYHSTDWTKYLDNDYARLGGNNATMTLRDRLRKIDGIVDVRRLDYLTSTFTMIIVQMTSEVAQAIEGMPIQTVQWESKGGMQLNFKVMTIMVPQLRADYYGNTGLCHATTT